MKILNFGSINIDLVYRVPHIVKPGETLSSLSLARFAGGKGNNQSIALARAGAPVFHAGKIGKDGAWIVAMLKVAGADVRFVKKDPGPTGHAVIQVADSGQNSIVLFPGANRTITPQEIRDTLAHFGKGDILLLQNEINALGTDPDDAGLQGCHAQKRRRTLDGAGTEGEGRGYHRRRGHLHWLFRRLPGSGTFAGSMPDTRVQGCGHLRHPQGRRRLDSRNEGSILSPSRPERNATS